MQEPIPSADRALLRITGAETESHTVPFEVLAKLLDGLQQTAYFMTAAESGIIIRSRFKPSAELRRTSTLRCDLPEKGSYALPIAAPFGRERLLEELYQLFQAVATANHEAFQTIFRDSSLQIRALLVMQKFFPKAGDRWGFAFGKPGKTETASSTFGTL